MSNTGESIRPESTKSSVTQESNQPVTPPIAETEPGGYWDITESSQSHGGVIATWEAENGPRYHIRKKPVGTGGTSEIRLCEDRKLGIQLAAKGIQLDSTIDPDILAHEIRILRELRHPNLPKIYDVIQFHDDPNDSESAIRTLLLMEYISGINLNELANDGMLNIGATLGILQKVSSAVEYLHSKGVLHLDLKGNNIIVCLPINEESVVKLIDFGTANQFDSTARTLSVIPPERFDDNAGANIQSEVFSYAILAYKILANKPKHPFTNEKTALAAFNGIVYDEPIPIYNDIDIMNAYGPRVLYKLDLIFRKAFMKDPEMRFPNTDEMYRAIKAAFEEEGGLSEGEEISRDLNDSQYRARYTPTVETATSALISRDATPQTSPQLQTELLAYLTKKAHSIDRGELIVFTSDYDNTAHTLKFWQKLSAKIPTPADSDWINVQSTPNTPATAQYVLVDQMPLLFSEAGRPIYLGRLRDMRDGLVTGEEPQLILFSPDNVIYPAPESTLDPLKIEAAKKKHTFYTELNEAISSSESVIGSNPEDSIEMDFSQLLQSLRQDLPSIDQSLKQISRLESTPRRNSDIHQIVTEALQNNPPDGKRNTLTLLVLYLKLGKLARTGRVSNLPAEVQNILIDEATLNRCYITAKYALTASEVRTVTTPA